MNKNYIDKAAFLALMDEAFDSFMDSESNCSIIVPRVDFHSPPILVLLAKDADTLEGFYLMEKIKEVREIREEV